MSGFDPHRAIPGTSMRMTPEQEQAWAENQVAELVAAMPESRGAASVTLDTIIAPLLLHLIKDWPDKERDADA